MFIRPNEKVVVTDTDHPEYGNVFFFAFKGIGPAEGTVYITRMPYKPSAANGGIKVFPAQISVVENRETD